MLPSDYCNLEQIAQNEVRYSEKTAWTPSTNPEDFMQSNNVNFAVANIWNKYIPDEYLSDLAILLHKDTSTAEIREKTENLFYEQAQKAPDVGEAPLTNEAKGHLAEWYEFLARKACKKQWYKTGADLIKLAKQCIKDHTVKQPNGLEELVKERQVISTKTGAPMTKTSILQTAENYLKQFTIDNGKLKMGDQYPGLPNPFLAYAADKVVKPIDNLLYTDDFDENLEHSTRANAKIMLLYYNFIELALRTCHLSKEPTLKEVYSLASKINVEKTQLSREEILQRIEAKLKSSAGEWQVVYEELKNHIIDIRAEHTALHPPGEPTIQQKKEQKIAQAHLEAQQTLYTPKTTKTPVIPTRHTGYIADRLRRPQEKTGNERAEQIRAEIEEQHKIKKQAREEAREKLRAKNDPKSVVKSIDTLMDELIDPDKQIAFTHKVEAAMSRLAAVISNPKILATRYSALSFGAGTRGLHIFAGRIQYRAAQTLATGFTDDKSTIDFNDVIEAYEKSMENYEKELKRKRTEATAILNEKTDEEIKKAKAKKIQNDINNTKIALNNVLQELTDFKTKNTSHDTKHPSDPGSKTKSAKTKQ